MGQTAGQTDERTPYRFADPADTASSVNKVILSDCIYKNTAIISRAESIAAHLNMA